MKGIKNISILLSLVFLFSLIGLFPSSAYANEGENGFTFSLVDDSYYVVTGYNGEESEACIPEQFDGKPVSGIDSNAF